MRAHRKTLKSSNLCREIIQTMHFSSFKCENLLILHGTLCIFWENPKEFTKNKLLTKFDKNHMDFCRGKSSKCTSILLFWDQNYQSQYGIKNNFHSNFQCFLSFYNSYLKNDVWFSFSGKIMAKDWLLRKLWIFS